MILTSALSRLTESMGRFENRYAGLGSRLGAAEYPEPNSTPRQHSVTESAESVGIVSYNILSFELADEEFYINLNNTPKIIDSKARMDAINTKVEAWMRANKIICLQEVTASFLSEAQNARLHELRSRHGYRFFWHYYSFQRKKDPAGTDLIGVHKMGLAILVPERIYSVERSVQLRPWQDSDMKVTDCLQLSQLEEEIRLLDEFLKKYAPRARTMPTVSDDVIAELGFVSIAVDPAISMGQLLGKINKLKESSRQKVRAIVSEYSRRPPSYNDRSVLLLEVRDAEGRRFVVGNVHIPCKYSAPKIMTSIALKTKQSIVDWLAKNDLDDAVTVLCGDFNSIPGDSVHGCFTGGLQFEDSSVNDEYVEWETFRRVVKNEPWHDLLKRFNSGGCTNYGFTKQGYTERYEKLKVYMDSLGPDFSQLVDAVMEDGEHEGVVSSYASNNPGGSVASQIASARAMKKTLFVPNQLMLDHFFLRDTRGHSWELVQAECPESWQVEDAFKGRPLPDLGFHEPSDHLAISVDLRIK